MAAAKAHAKLSCENEENRYSKENQSVIVERSNMAASSENINQLEKSWQ